MSLAPVILFAYNRPWYTKQTLDALSLNRLADQSILFIFCDGPKENISMEQLERIKQVREVIRKKKWCHEVHIIENSKNKGLANSIIDGVTEVINQHGKVIVLEDDLETGKGFLQFMNDGLERYANEPRVKQIAGFLFPIKKIKKNNASFLIPLTTTWGWGIWKRVWNTIDFNPSDWNLLGTDKELSYHFNLDGVYDYSEMLKHQMTEVNFGSWGILFWWSIFKQNGLVLYPDHTLVQHKDTLGTGTHKGNYSSLNHKNFDKNYYISLFPKKIFNDKEKFDYIREYLVNCNRKTWMERAFLKVKKYKNNIFK